jgi:hypothetical protein
MKERKAPYGAMHAALQESESGVKTPLRRRLIP